MPNMIGNAFSVNKENAPSPSSSIHLNPKGVNDKSDLKIKQDIDLINGIVKSRNEKKLQTT